MDHLYIDVNNENEATIYPVNTVITEPIPTTNGIVVIHFPAF